MGGLRLGRVLGITVVVRYSFVLLLVLAYYVGVVRGVGPLLALLLVLMCASVLVHEIAHALVARWLRVPVIMIDLDFFGGATRMARLPERPRDEMLIALAGPAASLLLALAGEVAYQITEAHALNYLIATNLLLGAFNLIPALPLDGGRVLRAGLGIAVGHGRATALAVRITQAVLLVAAAWALVAWEPLVLVFVALFWFQAQAELRSAVHWRRVDPAAVGLGDDDAVAVEVLDAEGLPAARRSTTLGTTYVIEEHCGAEGKRWVVRGEDGRVLIVTDTPLGAEPAAAAPLSPF